ncbi:unnamed protein product [Clavelina lepadiformis]|uniref:Uncharacterized protein n=1 Tax=Clavelina lepadiformis TaxID=159417 RepID=A0ABP0F0C7_CLALP
MASSLPLSLLSKGIGQVAKNGHERLDVYLEPEDYYNLQSKYQRYQVAELRRRAAQQQFSSQSSHPRNLVPLHKTFLTRKGALLLFSEELAKKNLEEERLQKERKNYPVEEEQLVIDEDHDPLTESLKTCNDLSYAILSYGRKPDYRRRGDDLFLRFAHEPKGAFSERRIRPGFSPKRYISTWSKSWDEGMLQKLRSSGMISDKTLYRQNPLLPHLYKYTSYNLAAIPPPYRVTRNMLLAPGNVPSYEFYRVKGALQPEVQVSDKISSKVASPSQHDARSSPIPVGSIQAVKYHETGEIQEVTYAELKPQEKQEILAELLIAAHEHQQHIRDTLKHVISSQRPHEGSERAGSSSAASELMADMHRAIMSLVESPVRQQMRERQRLIQEQETKLEEERRQQQLKEERREIRRQERKAKKVAEKEAAKKAAEEAREARRLAKEARKKAEEEKRLAEEKKIQERRIQAEKVKQKSQPPPEEADQLDSKEAERREKEERRRKRREEREQRRKTREEKKAVQEEKHKTVEGSIPVTEERAPPDVERPPFRNEHRPSPEEDNRHHRKHRRHRRHDVEEVDEVKDEKKDRHERRSRRRSEKEAAGRIETTGPVLHDDGGKTRHKHREYREAVMHSGYIMTSEKGDYGETFVQETERVRVLDKHSVSEAYAIVPKDGITEIEENSRKEKRPKLHQKHTQPGSVPTQVPTNTPAVDMRALAKQHVQSRAQIQYDDIIVVDHQSPTAYRRKSNASVVSAGSISGVHKTVEILQGESGARKGARSNASTHSSGPKQVLFAPELPVEESASQTGSFYGGRMPISSNLVKQTLSDKVSILSGSQLASEQGSLREQGYQSTKATSVVQKSFHSDDKGSDMIVPSIGIEPATPLHPKQKGASPELAVFSTHSQSVPGAKYLSPSGSGSHHSLASGPYHTGGGDSFNGGSPGGQHSEDRESLGGSLGRRSFGSRKMSSKKSGNSDDDESDRSDKMSQSSQSTEKHSVKREVASKSSQTVSSKSKPKQGTGLKGSKGPGSQSSSSFIKSKSTSSKKSSSTRGSLPSVMKQGSRISASLTMPDGEVVSVGGSVVRSSVPDQIVENESEESEDVLSSTSGAHSSKPEKESLKPTAAFPLKQTLRVEKAEEKTESSIKQDKRVSFKKSDDNVSTTTEEEEDEEMLTTGVSESDYDVTAEEDEEKWPVSQEEAMSNATATSSGSTRPISSRSEKLTAHAQKVASLVVKKQRPDSGLDEDAKAAAVLWNEAMQKEASFEDEESSTAYETSAALSKDETFDADKEDSSEDEEEKRRKEKFKTIISSKQQEKEIKASIPMEKRSTGKMPSATGSLSSIQSSVSSAQETFVSEMQRKASDLGIETSDLEFQAEVIHKLEKSDITPDDVEVVHDKEAGRHVVRSRRSSTTVSSVLTPSSTEVSKVQPSPRRSSDAPAPPKPKLVVDVVLPDKHSSATPSRSSSVTTSVTSQSPTTQQSPRSSVSQKRRSSIPVEKTDVKLDFDVTTYEGKLGDPKPEEPTIQSGRPQIEPEKIKKTDLKTKDTKLHATAKDNTSKAPVSSKGHPTGGSKSSAVGATESVKSSLSSMSKSDKKSIKQPHAPTKGPLRKGQAGPSKSKTDAPDDASVMSQLTENEKLKSKKTDPKKKKGPKEKKSEAPPPEKDVQRTTPEKSPTKTPEIPFKTGQPKESKLSEDMSLGNSPEELGKQESIASVGRSKKGEKTRKTKKQGPMVTQVEKDSPKVAGTKRGETPDKSQTPVSRERSPAKSAAKDTGTPDNEDDYRYTTPPESPEDDYEFVRKDDSPEPDEPEPEPAPEPEMEPEPAVDAKSQTSEITEQTESTEVSSQAAAQAAEEEAMREAKMAAKQEREQKRAAAAEKRKQEVERKRREKEEQLRKEKEEQERQEQMREELDAERKRRTEEIRRKKEEAERAIEREKQEEELRQKRLLQQQERERKQQEEYKRKMEELQKKKKEEEERRKLQAQQEAEEAAARKKQEEEMLAEMDKSERELYEIQKRKEEEERKKKEEEKRRREEEEAKIAMEQLRIETMIRAKQQAELEEKLRFVREFFTEANGMEQTQNVNRSFTFSYFELLHMLGLDVAIE